MVPVCAMERGQPLLLRLVTRDHRRHMRRHMHSAARQLVALQQFQVAVPLAAFAGSQQECEQARREAWAPVELAGALHAALRAAIALLAALLLHLGGPGVPGWPRTARASVAEDKLLEFVRQVEVKVDSAVEAVKDAAAQVGAPMLPVCPLVSCCVCSMAQSVPPAPVSHLLSLAAMRRAARARMRTRGASSSRRWPRWWRPTFQTPARPATTLLPGRS